MTIDINGDVIDEITIDGQDVTEVTADGDTVFKIPPVTAQNNLTAWYRFEDGDARDYTAGDSSFGDSTDHSGTVYGASYLSNGGVTDTKNGSNSGAFDFDGTGDKIETNFSPFSNSDHTVSYWIKGPSQDSGPAFNTWEAEAYGFFSGLGDRWGDAPNDRINYGMRYDNENANNIYTTQSYADNNWHHVVVTYDNSIGEVDGMNIYVDGNIQSTSTGRAQGDGNIKSSNVIKFGTMEPYESKYLDGKLDDIRIYNKILSSSEIQEIYDRTKP